MSSVRIAVLGLGAEASAIATSLAQAGAEVIGFDVRPPANPPVPLAESIADAVAGADAVLSLNSPTASLRIAEQAAPHLADGALFADLNAGTPALKTKIAAVIPGEVFVDVGMLPAADAAGSVTLAAAGPRAARLSELLAPLGLRVDVVSEQVGDAAARVLTRSILAKCLAGVVVDYMWAAEAMGLSEWAYGELLAEFDALSAETAKRYLTQTVSNPKRAEIEMVDIVEMLDSVDYHSIFVPPTQLIYNRIYHSIKVPFGTAAEQERFEHQGDAPAADW
ncbi:MAG: NAD(P)-binding domain-containing protein [Microbacteriaceae bacterium]